MQEHVLKATGSMSWYSWDLDVNLKARWVVVKRVFNHLNSLMLVWLASSVLRCPWIRTEKCVKSPKSNNSSGRGTWRSSIRSCCRRTEPPKTEQPTLPLLRECQNGSLFAWGVRLVEWECNQVCHHHAIMRSSGITGPLWIGKTILPRRFVRCKDLTAWPFKSLCCHPKQWNHFYYIESRKICNSSRLWIELLLFGTIYKGIVRICKELRITWYSSKEIDVYFIFYA